MTSRRRGRPAYPDLLTPSEWAVLDLLRHGLTRRQIAKRRGTGEDAVKYHLANIADKLGVRGTSRLRHWPGYPMATRRALAGAPPHVRPGEEKHMPQDSGAGRDEMRDDLQLGPIGQVSLSIRDVARAERFYGATLGLPHLFTFGDLAFFDAAGVRLYLHRKDEPDWRPGSILYFMCDDIGAAYRSLLARGVLFTGAPHLIYTDDETGAEEWMAFFEDGEGNTLALMSRVEATAG